MVGLFRTNQFVANILLVAYAFLVRFPIFFNSTPVQKTPAGGVIWEWFATSSWVQPGTSSAILATLLICFQAVLLNFIESRFKLSGELNLIPGMCYVLFVSVIPQGFYLSPLLLGMTFFLIALYEIMVCYKNFKASVHVFNVGFWISMAFLCYQSFWLYIIFGIIGLSIVMAIGIKEILMLMSGFVVPLFLSAVIFFFHGQFDSWMTMQINTALEWRHWNMVYGIDHLLALIVLGIFLLIAIIGHGRFLIKKGIHARKSIDVLYWSMVFGGVTLFIQPLANATHLFLLIPCLAYAFTFILLKRSGSQSEAIHFLIMALVIFWQFNPWA